MRRLTLMFVAVAVGVLALVPAAAFGATLTGPGAEQPTTEDTDGDGVDNCPDPEGDEDNQHPSGQDKHCESGGSGNQGNAQSDPDDDGRGPDRSNGGADQPGGEGGEDQLDQDGNNGCGNDDDFEDDNEGLCGGPEREQVDDSGQQRASGSTCPDGEAMTDRGCAPEREDEPTCPAGEQMTDDGCAPEAEGSEVAGSEDSTGSTSSTPTTGGEDVGGSTVEAPAAGGDVLGESYVAEQPAADVSAADGETAVLGVQYERAPDAAVDGASLQRTQAAPSVLARTGVPAVLIALGGLGLVTAGYGLRRKA